MLSRIRGDIFIRLFASLLLAVAIAVLPNYQYFVYQSMDKLTEDEIQQKGKDYCIGYQTSEDTYDADSIETIRDKEYCTITLKRSNLQATGYYRILDASAAGLEYGNDRNSFDTYHDTFASGKFVRFLLNNWGPQYGEFFVAKLESGESIVVLLDQTILTSSKSKTITLPLGKVLTTYPDVIFRELSSSYGLSDEAQTWYIDMAGANFVNSEQMSSLQNIRFVVGIIVFVILYIIFTWLMKKFHLF